MAINKDTILVESRFQVAKETQAQISTWEGHINNLNPRSDKAKPCPSGVVHINLTGFENLLGLDGSVIKIYDISGRTVGSLRATPLQNHAGTISINVSNLPSGVYVLKIGDYSGRFVKE